MKNFDAKIMKINNKINIDLLEFIKQKNNISKYTKIFELFKYGLIQMGLYRKEINK